MTGRFFDPLYPLSIIVLTALPVFVWTKDNLNCTIRLDHDWPVYGSYIEYVPLYEKAYIVSDHVMLTREPHPGHFPDDAVVLHTNTRAYFYWVDRYDGIKAFLTEDAMLPLHVKVLPAGLRMLYYPRWVRASLPYVVEELEKDGGWRDRIAAFEEDRESYERRWAELRNRSEKRLELYEQWLEGNGGDDAGRIYRFPTPDEVPYGLGRKGD